MHLLNNLRISTRLALGFGCVLLLLILTVVVAASRFDSIGRATDSLLNEAWVKAAAVKELDAATRANGTRTLELLLSQDAARAAELRARISANRERATSALATLQKLVKRPEGQRLLADIVALRAQYVESFQRVDAEVAAGTLAAATERCRNETIPLLERLQAQTKALAELQDGLAREAGESVHGSVASGFALILALGAGALVLGAACAWGLSRSCAC